MRIIMKLKRYYINEPLKENKVYKLENEEFHHLVNVMRTKVGENIELFCGDEYNYLATIAGITKKFAEVKIISKSKNIANPKIKIDVYQALAKGDKLSIITQKITELGASELFVFYSKFCDVKPTSSKPEKLEQVTINACKQCGRSLPVKINSGLNITDVCKAIKNYDKFFVCYEAEENDSLTNYIKSMSNDAPKSVATMIGAEGGFSEDEIKLLKNSGAIIVGLGSRILRTETASIAATAVISQMLNN